MAFILMLLMAFVICLFDPHVETRDRQQDS